MYTSQNRNTYSANQKIIAVRQTREFLYYVVKLTQALKMTCEFVVEL